MMLSSWPSAVIFIEKLNENSYASPFFGASGGAAQAAEAIGATSAFLPYDIILLHLLGSRVVCGVSTAVLCSSVLY